MTQDTPGKPNGNTNKDGFWLCSGIVTKGELYTLNRDHVFLFIVSTLQIILAPWQSLLHRQVYNPLKDVAKKYLNVSLTVFDNPQMFLLISCTFYLLCADPKWILSVLLLWYSMSVTLPRKISLFFNSLCMYR